MKYEIIVEPQAMKDLQNIYNYIKNNDSETKAIIFTNELKDSINSLSHMPMRCRKSIYIDKDDARDLIHKGYTIVFAVKKYTIHILTLFRQKSF